MNRDLFIQAVLRFFAGALIVSLLLFLPAGTLRYPQGWLLMGILFVPMFAAGLVMLKKNPELLKKRLNVNPTLHFTQTARMGGRKTCVLSLTGADAHTLLNALHMAETDEDGQMHLKRTAPRHPMTRQCCRRAFLRGAFLGAGTMTNPEKGYHFEWKAEDEQLPRTLEKLLEKCD
ncbi:MAG: hypothetical protein IKF16_06775, partial [Lachnospiraceae bacterium]|nr:hypothetical protein [Lachnospiraceae bacterium]